MKPLTSLLLLLLWVYWQAANNFTAYTATRSPRLGVPAASTEAFRVNRQNADTSSSPPLPCFLLCCHKLVSAFVRWANANNANARIIKWRLYKTFQSFTGRGFQFAQPIRTGALFSPRKVPFLSRH